MSNQQNKTKKITILINTLLLGGAERMVFDICDKIDKNEFDMHVVYMKSHKYFKNGNQSFLELILKTGVKVTCLEGKNRSAIKESISLWKILRKEKPDILQTFLPYAGAIGRTIGRLAGVKKIISVQCNLSMSYSKRVDFIDKITLFLASVWTAASVAIEEEYGGSSVFFSEKEWLNGRRHFTVVSGVDVDDIQKIVKNTDIKKKKEELGIKENCKTITMTARLISWKGHDDLLKSFVLIPKNTELILVGDGPRMLELKSRAGDLNILERVHFLGNRSDLFEIMAITDVYVQSYSQLSTGFVWKGPNTSQMVAAAARVPAVSTNVSLIETFMKDNTNGRIALINNPEDLAEKITYLLENEKEAERMAENAFKTVATSFSLKAMVDSYCCIYECLIQG